jgi:asparagine synthase (glutamine-hydrolysing)
VTLVRDGVDVIHACNPPDTLFVLGMLLRPFGVRFVFDQHDLCPEVYDARFPTGSGIARRGLLALERGSYRLADQVIVTNESYKQVALTRGGIGPSKVTVVRSGPDPASFRRGERDPGHAHGREYLCCYLGVMGPQDGVDLALRAIDVFVHHMKRTDTQFVFIGAGDRFDDLRALARELELDEFVDFTGRLPANDPELLSVLSSADIGLCPDPFNALNDASTMNKTLEYMAFELPVVAFDLHETRVSAREAAVYVTPNDVGEYARAIGDLLDDPDRRRSMGTSGRRRVEGELSWQHQVPALLSVYSRVVPLASPSTGTV